MFAFFLAFFDLFSSSAPVRNHPFSSNFCFETLGGSQVPTLFWTG